jgi:hypothetical protein
MKANFSNASKGSENLGNEDGNPTVEAERVCQRKLYAHCRIEMILVLAKDRCLKRRGTQPQEWGWN